MMHQNVNISYAFIIKEKAVLVLENVSLLETSLQLFV